jgi:DNA-binding IclR family transcriptional regulator
MSRVLDLLEAHGAMTTAAVARHLGISRPAAYTALWKAERSGCARRTVRVGRNWVWEVVP